MITQKQYNMLKEKFGNVASWAIWKEPNPEEGVKSNMMDVSMFDDYNCLNELNPDFVFVGLNASGRHDGYMDESRPWFNFHSSYRYGQDYKLRYAVMNTDCWGAYITDIIKDHPEVDSTQVLKEVKKNPDILKTNIEVFTNEIAILGKKPILIALGDGVYDILNKSVISEQYTIKKIHHYAYRDVSFNKETYRQEVLEVLKTIN